MGILSQFVPGRQRRLELVVGLGVIGTEVAGCAKVFAEAFHVVRDNRGIGRRQLRSYWVRVPGPHVVGADGDRIHAGDDCRSSRGADSCGGKAAGPAASLSG